MNLRILGIDYGTSRIGIAISDPLQTIATPLETIKNNSTSDVLEKIFLLSEKFNFNTIVIGLPLNMSGSDTKQSKSIRKFSELLKKKEYNVKLEDERLTSIIAKKSLIFQKKNTGLNKQLVDKTAAALILQNYLDKQKKKSKL